jgi:hypothetical protein
VAQGSDSGESANILDDRRTNKKKSTVRRDHLLGNPRGRREQNGATTFPSTTVFLATARPCVAVRATKKEIFEDHDEERLGLR